MKILLTILVTLLSVISSMGQNDTSIQQEEVVLVADEMPSFPGGEKEMANFLKANLKYPAIEQKEHISGKCYVIFVVEKDGSITGAKILKGVTGGPGCDAEALRVVRQMPKWNPGKHKGKVVRVQLNLPIKFTLFSNDLNALTDTTYFDAGWVKSSKAEASFYRIISKRDDGYLVKDIYIKSGLPQMIAICNEIDPLKKNGKCTFYFENGQKESEGNYVKNEKNGVWITWDKDGKDSSVIECFPGKMYKNIRISKNQETVNDKLNVLYPIQVNGEFPGGELAMQDFIIENIVYPVKEKKEGIVGTCYLTFVIETDGTLSNIRILRGVPGGEGYDQEAMRIIRSMPKWKPGMQYGKIVRVQFNLPIRFTLRD